MPKFLIEASYSAEGLKGLQKDKASGRTTAIKNALKAADGKLECVYWCLGDHDVILVADLPDTMAACALATTISATGFVRTKTTALLTAEEVDKALGAHISYHPPGR